jgi:translation elongation factor aEF-1 beta
MGKALVKIKIMPESPDTSLGTIEEEAKKIVKEIAGTEAKTEKEPIAFGLNAVILQFIIDEAIPLDGIEEKLRVIPTVSSIDIIDFRRAFG